MRLIAALVIGIARKDEQRRDQERHVEREEALLRQDRHDLGAARSGPALDRARAHAGEDRLATTLAMTASGPIT
jgi:hypothetical protein